MENANPKAERLISTSITKFLSEKPPILVNRITSAPNEYYSAYYSDYPSIWLCLDGTYTHRIETGDLLCKPRTLLIIPPGVMHFAEIAPESKILIVRLILEYNAYMNVDHNAYINSITHLLLPSFSDELGFTPTLSVKLSSASLDEAKKIFDAPSLKSLERLFSLPEFSLSQMQRESALSVFSSRVLPVLRAITYIQKNYALKISSERLAEVSGLCRTNLFLFFKKYLGIPHSIYTIMLRVIRAQYAIAHTQYSLQYISDMCGFSTSSYMTKCYKKYKGFSPKEDRANMKVFRKRYPNIHISHAFFEE